MKMLQRIGFELEYTMNLYTSRNVSEDQDKVSWKDVYKEYTFWVLW